jgi:hypothetical protein
MQYSTDLNIRKQNYGLTQPSVCGAAPTFPVAVHSAPPSLGTGPGPSSTSGPSLGDVPEPRESDLRDPEARDWLGIGLGGAIYLLVILSIPARAPRNSYTGRLQKSEAWLLAELQTFPL